MRRDRGITRVCWNKYLLVANPLKELSKRYFSAMFDVVPEWNLRRDA